jgi:hypothetical protein
MLHPNEQNLLTLLSKRATHILYKMTMDILIITHYLITLMNISNTYVLYNIV